MNWARRRRSSTTNRGAVISPDATFRTPGQDGRAGRLPRGERLAELGDRPWAYFLHTFAAPPSPEVVAPCDYGGPVTAAIERDRRWAPSSTPRSPAPLEVGTVTAAARSPSLDAMVGLAYVRRDVDPPPRWGSPARLRRSGPCP
ncbi:MAG: hypothetical protein ACRDY5_01265, partial [Acidimicrobiales bacterium]